MRWVLLLCVGICFLCVSGCVPSTGQPVSPQPSAKTVNLRGVVLGPGDKPVPGCKLYASRSLDAFLDPRPREPEAVSNDAGRFSCQVPEHWCPLMHTLIAIAPGYAWGVTFASADKETTIRLSTERVQCAGRALDTRDQPVAGAAVAVAGIDLKRHGSQEPPMALPALVVASTDSSGAFQIPDLPPNCTIALTCSAEGYALGAASWLRPDATDILFPMTREAIVTGRLVSKTESLQGTKVQMNGGPPAEADGRFELHKLSPGEHTLVVTPRDGAQYIAQDNITLTEGQRLDLGEIQVPPYGTVTGTVTHATTRQPIAGAYVEYHVNTETIYSERAREAICMDIRVETDAQGQYRVRLPQGTARLEAHPPAREFNMEPWGQPHSREVDVRGGEVTANVDFTLKPKAGANLRGRLVLANGKPVPGAIVSWVMLGSNPYGASHTRYAPSATADGMGASRLSRYDAMTA